MPLSPARLGLLLSFTCYMLWSVDDALCKLAIGWQALPAMEMVALYAFMNAAAAMLTGVAQTGWKVFRPNKPVLVLGLAPLGVGVFWGNYYAFKFLSLPEFYVIAFSAPLLITSGASLFLGERLPRLGWLAVIVGFIGIVVAMNPFGLQGNIGHITGYAGAILAALCYTAGQITTRRISQHEQSATLIFYRMLVTAVIAFLVSLKDFLVVPEGRIILAFIAAATINTLATVMLIRAIRETTAANTSALHYTQIIPATLLSYLIWQQIPSIRVIAGIAIIIASGLLMIRATKPNSASLRTSESHG